MGAGAFSISIRTRTVSIGRLFMSVMRTLPGRMRCAVVSCVCVKSSTGKISVSIVEAPASAFCRPVMRTCAGVAVIFAQRIGRQRQAGRNHADRDNARRQAFPPAARRAAPLAGLFSPSTPDFPPGHGPERENSSRYAPPLPAERPTQSILPRGSPRSERPVTLTSAGLTSGRPYSYPAGASWEYVARTGICRVIVAKSLIFTVGSAGSNVNFAAVCLSRPLISNLA